MPAAAARLGMVLEHRADGDRKPAFKHIQLDSKVIAPNPSSPQTLVKTLIKRPERLEWDLGVYYTLNH